jgi:23S rRNA A2030 N6-methylase RlmJ
MGPEHDAGLAGSGVLVVNPPFTLESDLRVLMSVVCPLLAPESAARTDWLAREHEAGRRR